MDHLDELEAKSIHIIREAYRKFKPLALLWSVGKDSTTLLWLARKAFYGQLPFPALHIDTGQKFPAMIEFRDRYAKEWNLNLIVGRNEAALAEGWGPAMGDRWDKLGCCTKLKTEALKQTIDNHGFKALLVGIRRDEHGIRAKERVFSPRDYNFNWDYTNQPPELWDQYKSKQAASDHIRVHPLLHWTEEDIWAYIQRESIPCVPLYFAQEGQRYRSLGCECCCGPIPSQAATIDEVVTELAASETSERAGRAQDKEQAYMMQKLRSLGYM